jgi:hypothetical protein
VNNCEITPSEGPGRRRSRRCRDRRGCRGLRGDVDAVDDRTFVADDGAIVVADDSSAEHG